MARTERDSAPKHVLFIHPDLGIGGAERLVIDAAVGLQSLGHKVLVVTSHFDKDHCFTEACDGTLQVLVRGDVWPTTLFGRFAILCAIIRQLHLIVQLFFFSSPMLAGFGVPSHIVVDQLSAGVPLIRCLTDRKILFYCHFPDKLLALEGAGLMRQVKRLYRLPFNLIESWSTGCSDDIVVNSKFTASTVRSAFPGLRSRDLRVLYPCVDTEAILGRSCTPLKLDRILFLSINRFERKKEVGLAIEAYARLPRELKQRVLLALAGGYDHRVNENVEHLEELQHLTLEKSLKCQTLHGQVSSSTIIRDTNIVFLPSVSDSIKQSLLSTSDLLIYTPRNEHFGIVPLEAMLNEVPVLAANQGGPTETVVDDMTGWLRDASNVDAWTAIMAHVVHLKSEDPVKLTTMGRAGKVRVKQLFSKHEMASRLDSILDGLEQKSRPTVISPIKLGTLLLGIFSALVYVLQRLLLAS